MLPMWRLTRASRSASADLTSARSTPSLLAAAPGSPPTPHDGGRPMSCRRAKAIPTSKRKIEPRWLPPPRAGPRCCDNRPQSVLRLPALMPWVPTRTTRNPSPDPERVSPSSQKK